MCDLDPDSYGYCSTRRNSGKLFRVYHDYEFYLDIWKPVLDLSSYSYRTVRTNPVLRGSEIYDKKKDYFGYIMIMNFLDIWKPDLDLSSLSNESGTTRQCKLQQTNKWFYVLCSMFGRYGLRGSNNKQINYDK